MVLRIRVMAESGGLRGFVVWPQGVFGKDHRPAKRVPPFCCGLRFRLPPAPASLGGYSAH